MRYIDRSLAPIPESLLNERTQTEKQLMYLFFNEPASKKQRRYTFQETIYNNEDVKIALIQLFNAKCAYCETVLYGDFAIEHFRPKSGAMNLDGRVDEEHYWWLAYEWTNLYASCNSCNRYKRTRFPVIGKRAQPMTNSEDYSFTDENYLLLDPCKIEDFIEPQFRMTDEGVYIGQTKRGEVTIEILNLNRDSLVLGRKKVKDEIEQHMNSAKRLTEHGELYNYLQQTLLDKINLNSPFLSIAQYYIGLHIQDTSNVKNQAIFSQFANELIAGKPHQPDQIAISQNIQPERYIEKKISQDYSMALETKVEKEAYFSSSKSIQRIEISNFKIIKYLNLEFPKSEPNQEAWMVLLGENGTGKSSLLQAIALALAGEKKANGLGLDASKFVNRNVRSKSGYVKIYLNGTDEPTVLNFSKDSKTFTGTNDNSKVILLGFGSTRLMADDYNVFLSNNVTNLHNLFNPFASLPNVEEWVSNRKLVDVSVFDQIAIELKKLLQLPDDNLIYRRKTKDGDYELFVKTQSNKKGIKLRELSSGYQAIIVMTLNIIKELLATWNSISIAEGIVLIDEIGVHLHPKWKMLIISTLREIFPALTFIITTHEPLCLRGVREGEVVLMKLDDNQEVIALTDLPSPNGLTIEQLITSKFFGLITSFDPEVEKQLNAYYLLKSRLQLTPEERTELNRIKTNLERIHILDADSNLEVTNSSNINTSSNSPLDAGWVSNPKHQSDLKDRIKAIWDKKSF